MIHNPSNMSISSHIRNLLIDPAAEGLDLESDEATRVHSEMIRKKAFLKKLYERYYGEFVSADRASPSGLRLEIGAGGGFLEDLIPSLATFDIRPGAKVSAVASALCLPLKNVSVGCVFMLNVLHHLPDVRLFFEELKRTLIPGGRAVFIEPYVSSFSKLIYKNLHHEPFVPEATNWNLDGDSAMSSANGALPWILFVRDRAKFESEFPELRISRVEPHTILLYLLSGGVSMRSLIPGPLFDPICWAEKLIGPRFPFFDTMMTVEIVRQ